MEILQSNYEWDLLEVMLVEFSIAKYDWHLPEVYQLKIGRVFSAKLWVRFARGYASWVFSGKIWLIFARGLSIENWSSFVSQIMSDICPRFINWKLVKLYRSKYDRYLLDIFQLKIDQVLSGKIWFRFFCWKMIKFYRAKYDRYLVEIF